MCFVRGIFLALYMFFFNSPYQIWLNCSYTSETFQTNTFKPCFWVQNNLVDLSVRLVKFTKAIVVKKLGWNVGIKAFLKKFFILVKKVLCFKYIYFFKSLNYIQMKPITRKKRRDFWGIKSTKVDTIPIVWKTSTGSQATSFVDRYTFFTFFFANEKSFIKITV